MPIISFAAKVGALRKIHAEISAKRYPNASTLARLLEVSTKTVGAYLKALPEMSGVAPRYDNVKRGYFYPSTVPAELMPRLKEEELIAYFLLEESARCYSGTPISAFLDSALEKLATLLPTGNGISLDQLSQAISLRLERAPALPPVAGILAELSDAILKRRQIQILYRSTERTDAERRIINPLHLTRMEGQWYLIAFCTARQALRQFVPARMQEMVPLKTHFTPPPDFNAVEYLSNRFGIDSGTDTINLRLLFKPEVARLISERTWHPTQVAQLLPDGSIRLTLTCTESRDVIAWLLSWGPNVRIEQPESFKNRIADLHMQALER